MDILKVVLPEIFITSCRKTPAFRHGDTRHNHSVERRKRDERTQVQNLSNRNTDQADTGKLQLFSFCVQQNAGSAHTGIQNRKEISFLQYNGQHAAFS